MANNGTIIILQEYSSSVTVYRPVVFKIKDPDKLFTGGVYSGPGYALHVDVGSDGTNTYTVTKIGVSPVPGAKTLADFVDLNPDAWYACGIEYALQKGLMEGVTGTDFDPDATTTRAMMVTMLYRAAGKPASTGTVSFKDVPANAWFAKAVEWAASNGLVNGYSKDTFAPNDPITREQMATLLFRYAAYRHDDVKARASLSSFEDADRISSWAVPAFRWADASGLICGLTDHMLDLRADSTRAQVAELMMRFETDMERK